MARGFFSGVIAGTLVSGLGLGTASVLTSDGGMMAPKTGSVEVSDGSGFNQPKDDTAAALPAETDTPEAGQVPQVAAPEPDDLTVIDEADLEPAAQPETGTADGALGTPATGDGAADVAVDSESPVLPSPQAAAPELPASEEDLSISIDPAQPSTPDVEDSAVFPEEELAAVAEETVEVPEASEAPETPETQEDNGVEATEPEAEPIPESEPEDVVTGSAATEPETDDTDTPDADASETDTPDTGLAGDTTEPSSTIGDLAPEVKTNRLPSVTDEPAADAPDDAVTEADPEAVTEPADDIGTPLERYAAEFENSEGKPLMSIVLIDDGSSPIGLEALESFPYPLSFAVDASWDGAADAMAMYRASGFEVLAMINLPEGAGAQDTEVAMQANLAKLPEVVAVMDGTGSGLQASREASDQLAPILLDSGHGAVLFPKGLNTAQQLLAREGVPSASVFRDFDASGQNATVIRRFLDQAAFKAGQEEGGVVMVGRLRPDTVSALLLWGLQDRASRVALAPVSAMLNGND
ncbi:polysaccharide deacteylase family 2 protein [Roseovarius sp. 2305UL8-3]|uniref:polysaccharide deacteylase family 2 protein n=1 Tax=Roseovarius conchicola TaxID=3121636 RepID=UPI003528513A